VNFKRTIQLFIFLFVFSFYKSVSQEELNSAVVEQKSYQLYVEKNWSELINYGKMSITKGYDYFYMRMRVGIAYYEKKNYSLAFGHFKKALIFNSSDELAQEYLYYCYSYNGMYNEARLLSRNFSSDLAKKIGTDTKSPIDFVVIEGGTKLSDSASYYDSNKKTSSNYFDPAVYFQAGLGHSIKNRVSLFHAFTYFKQKSFIGTTNQTQYYLKAAIPFKNDFLISPSFHYVGIGSSTESVVTVTPPQPPPPPGMPLKTSTVVTTSSSQSNYFVGSLSVQKICKKFTFSVGCTISNMSNVTQFIHSGAVSYYVFGNSKLVLGCADYLHTINTYSTLNNSIAPFIYVQPFNRLSIKASYLINSGNNIIEDNGYLVNNSPDLTKSRWSLLANVVLSKHVSIYGLYQFENKTESKQSFNYHYNVIVGGIKITP
jgi:tetratricopeptide (TPR) repeat protein